jgi:pyridinium-3,5-bisthiocarboxylic acid mononucleotide nickel chelatase
MIAWINPATGLAGDMFLAALLDAGAPLPVVREAIASTGLTGWELSATRVVDHGLTATRVQVSVTDTATSRAAAELISLAGQAKPTPVAEVAVAALRAIATTEARLHGSDPDAVHLHELGGHDTIVDIVGVVAALHALDVTSVHCAPLPLGTGTVSTRHGVLPCPAPATVALLTGAAVTGTTLTGETVTPTAAALLRALGTSYEPVPSMQLGVTGYGAGTRTLTDRPNAVAINLGSSSSARSLVMLETTVDDVTGETLGHVLDRVLAEGALDAWVVPVTMKKSRPGHVVHVLAAPDSVAALRELVLAETGSLGIRAYPVSRTALPRQISSVLVDGCEVRVKSGPHGSKPEFDDVAAAARRLGLPLREVARRAALGGDR